METNHTNHHHSENQSCCNGKHSFFMGINWKKEVLDAIEILKLNKTKMHEIGQRKEATKVGLAFILVPQIVSLILVVIMAKGFIGWVHGTYIIQMITPFLFIYGVHLCATQLFKGKGDIIAYFRVVSYSNVIALVIPVIVLLSFISYSLSGLMTIVMLAMGIWMLVVSYYTVMESYHVNSQNTIFTLIIAMVAVWIIITILNNILFPNPLEDLARSLGDYSRYIR